MQLLFVLVGGNLALLAALDVCLNGAAAKCAKCAVQVEAQSS